MKGKQGKEIKIKGIEKYPVYIPFKRVHKISLGRAGGREILLIKIHTDQGITGVGEAIAHPAFSGETLGGLLGRNPISGRIPDWKEFPQH